MEYDELDVESVVWNDMDEAEDMDAEDAGFLRGYLGMGET
jgi:hypothetical protein